jgi:hypothetical protein
MVIRISYKEAEEIVSSKVIIMEGRLLNANTIKTIGVDSEWRKCNRCKSENISIGARSILYVIALVHKRSKSCQELFDRREIRN